MNNDVEKVLYTQDQVNQRLDELANTLTEKYQDEFPVLVSVMTGAMIFSQPLTIIHIRNALTHRQMAGFGKGH